MGPWLPWLEFWWPQLQPLPLHLLLWDIHNITLKFLTSIMPSFLSLETSKTQKTWKIKVMWEEGDTSTKKIRSMEERISSSLILLKSSLWAWRAKKTTHLFLHFLHHHFSELKNISNEKVETMGLLWKGMPSSSLCISIFASVLPVSNESKNENDFVNNFPQLP